MSTHRSHRPNRSRRAEDGNHNLVAAVVALTAILGALVIYTFVFRPNQRSSQKQTPTQSRGTKTVVQTPDSPTGRTSFVGIVKENSNNRLTVRTTVTQDGTTQERLMLVTTTSTTQISMLDALKTGNGASPTQTRTKIPATFSDLKIGTGINVTAASVIDNVTAVTATAIDIITPAT